jgi:uncharacterized membrane protein YgaE (UPF0421/DUF939 family)
MGVALVVVMLGAPFMSTASDEKSIEQMIAEEQTLEDHAAIIAYYQREAEVARKKQAQYERMRDTYAKHAQAGPRKRTASVAFCAAIAARYERIAAENEGLARIHQEVAHKGK